MVGLRAGKMEMHSTALKVAVQVQIMQEMYQRLCHDAITFDDSGSVIDRLKCRLRTLSLSSFQCHKPGC